MNETKSEWHRFSEENKPASDRELYIADEVMQNVMETSSNKLPVSNYWTHWMYKALPQPPPKPTPPKLAVEVKYLLVQLADAGDPKIVTIYNTPEERAAATKEAILGPDSSEPCPQLEELAEEGKVRFEGDPGLDWIDAIVEVSKPPNSKPAVEVVLEKALAKTPGYVMSPMSFSHGFRAGYQARDEEGKK